MRHHLGRRILTSTAACLTAGATLTACFSGGNSTLAADCSAVKSAMEDARGQLSNALSKGITSPQDAAAEMRTVAADLRTAGEDIKDAELRNALNASADDLEKMFGSGGGAPQPNAGAGLGQLDQTIQRKCSTG